MNFLLSKKITFITKYKPIQAANILKDQTGKPPRFIFGNPGTLFLGYVENYNFKVRRNAYRSFIHTIKYPALIITGNISLEPKETQIHLTFKYGKMLSIFICIMPVITIMLIGINVAGINSADGIIPALIFFSLLLYGFSALKLYTEYSKIKKELIELLKQKYWKTSQR